MSRAGVLVLLAALCVALVSGLGTQRWASSLQSAAKLSANGEAVPVVRVLAARHPLGTGQRLSADDLRWVTWPQHAVTDGYLIEGKEEADAHIGAVLRSAKQAGQPILRSALVRPGEGSFMSAVLAEGKRAASVRVTDTSGVSGFVAPGDHVDVVLIHQLPRGSGGSRRVGETILLDVRVIAVDQKLSTDPERPSVVRTVTFELEPCEVERLMLGNEMGNLALTLRSLARDGESAVIDRCVPPASYARDSDISALYAVEADVGASEGGNNTAVTQPSAGATIIRGGSGR